MWFGILIGITPLFIGYLLKVNNTRLMNKINQCLSIMVYLILFLMGSELAQLEDLINNLQNIFLSTSILFA